ncbi:MAG: VOC family protein [Micrococcales bacterium]
MFTSLFLNMSVTELAKSKEFFAALGFEFNQQFTDDRTLCLKVSDGVLLMLSDREKFKGFIDAKEIAASNTTEAILSFSCASADQVRELSEKAFELGARRVNEFEDHGFMISWGFEDLDGHLWDLFWFNPDHKA